jgi:Ser-tRNA(Ala) deacylase AlaX
MTEPLYMNDFHVVDCETEVTEAYQEAGRQVAVLAATCFYPRGGGQDWDTGKILSADAELSVEEVRLGEGGEVRHIGSMVTGSLRQGDRVRGRVDVDRRRLNTRLHSAGHLVDMAVARLGLPWTPGRGAHYPHMSFVEYEGPFEPGQAGDLGRKLERELDALVAAGGANTIKFVRADELASYCRHVPTDLPRHGRPRVVIYGGWFGVPCGGTHVADLSDIGRVSIKKIRRKEEPIRVSYAIAPEPGKGAPEP